jgi:thioredoxin-related protein
MENLNKKLELFSNIAIILVAVTLIGVVIYKVLPEAKQIPTKQLKAGSEFSLPDVNWAENKKTLVLVLQKGCHFCTDSASFYKTLAEKNQNNNKVKLVAAFPHSVDEAKNYLSELGVAITDIRYFKFGKEIDGTPTLVLVDEQGKVADSWEGKLSSEEEQAVFEKLNL